MASRTSQWLISSSVPAAPLSPCSRVPNRDARGSGPRGSGGALYLGQPRPCGPSLSLSPEACRAWSLAVGEGQAVGSRTPAHPSAASAEGRCLHLGLTSPVDSGHTPTWERPGRFRAEWVCGRGMGPRESEAVPGVMGRAGPGAWRASHTGGPGQGGPGAWGRLREWACGAASPAGQPRPRPRPALPCGPVSGAVAAIAGRVFRGARWFSGCGHRHGCVASD